MKPKKKNVLMNLVHVHISLFSNNTMYQRLKMYSNKGQNNLPQETNNFWENIDWLYPVIKIRKTTWVKHTLFFHRKNSLLPISSLDLIYVMNFSYHYHLVCVNWILRIAITLEVFVSEITCIFVVPINVNYLSHVKEIVIVKNYYVLCFWNDGNW